MSPDAGAERVRVRAESRADDGDHLPNRSRLLPTSVTLLSGRTLAIARFGWGEVGPRQRAGRGWQRFNMCCAAVTPPRTAFGSPTLPQPKPRIPGFRPPNKVIRIGNSP